MAQLIFFSATTGVLTETSPRSSLHVAALKEELQRQEILVRVDGEVRHAELKHRDVYSDERPLAYIQAGPPAVQSDCLAAQLQSSYLAGQKDTLLATGGDLLLMTIWFPCSQRGVGRYVAGTSGTCPGAEQAFRH